MKIKITARDVETDEIRVLGTVLTDSTNRALQMYEDELAVNESMEYEIL